VPKTIDNDLAVTDTCPGFGSAAKYTAVSVREAALDVAAMAETSTRVFIYEAMGRHAGWLAAAAGLAGNGDDEAPHIILLPERAYDEAAFLAKVKAVVERVGYCVVVASEGIATADGRFVADAGGGKDSFGHSQLGGVAAHLAGRVKDQLGLKVHWALPDYLQRSARHLASRTDWEQAQAVGKAAVQLALKGQNGVMPVIVRSSDAPYRWKIEAAPLSKIANHEKKMPAGFIRRDGFGITARARAYLSPLIKGEAPLPYGADGRFVADAGGGKDSFGHSQLGGVAAHLAGRVKDQLGLKVHWALPDYLQRSARHLASRTDWEQAQAVGKAAVQLALKGQNGVMPVIVRSSDAPYRWKIEAAPLSKIANHEKKMPAGFIRRDGFGITAKARAYLSPLIKGEAPLPYGADGLPKYVTLKNVAVKQKLPPFEG